MSRKRSEGEREGGKGRVKRKENFPEERLASTEHREEVLSLEGYFAGLPGGSSTTG